jgi:16S rRNA (cytosine1402-N4)-methyltransferase
LGKHKNAILRHASYADLAAVMEKESLPPADAFLLDLGFSSEQLSSGKGFAFNSDEPLRMTYDPAATPAYEILREMSEAEIEEMLRLLGDERYSKKLASAIYARERQAPIATTKQLADLVAATVPANYERGRIHPATRTFQALRIYTNDELGNLHKILDDLPRLIAPRGRVAIISFHSLEDRIVKHSFRELEKQGTFKIITKKPIEANAEEIQDNPRSRSAKLRVIEKTA